TDRTMPLRDGLSTMWNAWVTDEFVVDPSRITVEISGTGVDGDTFKHDHLMDRYGIQEMVVLERVPVDAGATFKHDHLMDRYGIQVNKTSRNTVLFMTNIGTSRSAVAYLIEVLVKLAGMFNDPHEAHEPDAL